MKASLLVFALSLCIASNLSAQNPLWQRTNGPGGADITGITFDSSGGAIVLSNHAFRTTNDGLSWEQLPQLPGDLHTLPNGDLVGAFDDSIKISNDLGHSWKMILQTRGSIAVTMTGEIFVATSASHLFRTSDEGASWDSLVIPQMWGRIFAFNSPTLFFLGNDNYPFLYRSTNNGADWSKVVNGLTITEAGYDDLCGTTGGVVYYVALNGQYVSTDEGRTWKSIGAANIGYPRIAISKQGIVCMSNYEKLMQIDQSGKILSTIEDGFPDYVNSRSEFHPLVASPGGEFWMSWGSFIGKVDPRKQNSFSLIDPPTGSISLLIATATRSAIADSKTDAYPYMYRTTDAGTSWTTIPYYHSPSLLVFDSSHSILTALQGQITRSTDEGTSWKGLGSILTSPPVTSIVVDPQGFIYMGCGEGVFRSTDNGNTWDQLNIGLTDVSVLSLTVNAGGDVFAGTVNAIFHSTDHAFTWQALPFTPPDNSGISILTVNTSGDLLAVVKDSGVFWSHDDGQNWSSIGSGLSGKINALLSTPIGHVFAGTDSGVFYLPSGGGTWINANSGLGNLRVLSITRDQAGTVYLGTDGSGVFSSTQQYNVANSSSVEAPIGNTSDIILENPYPNPLSNFGDIRFFLSKPTHVRIELFSIIGEHIRILCDEDYGNGVQTIHINTTGLANGVYRLLVTAGNTIKTGSLIISK